ncbi:hypothetical protein F8388_003365 [Cannabis sativa]|uniref:Endonuclease/exonuclease/phosphatase domain-containing protein n=1 Tax=Cannabis sativa TaxID=3483 RepID=A0A7J6FDB5_CANSA|nr:hypothetical protein F8388_003365 [Cannabis sativa]
MEAEGHVSGAAGGEGQIVMTESAPARLGGLARVESSAIYRKEAGAGFFYGRGGGPNHAPQSPMKVLSWNCRGLGSPSAKKALRALVHREDSDVLYLMETKVNSSRMNGIWRGLGFGGASVSDSRGTTGGVISVKPGVTTVLFSNVLHGPNWYGLFVYGPPIRYARNEFWEERTLEILALSHPWLLVGDLNSILCQEEKFGGRVVEENDGQDLNDFVGCYGWSGLGLCCEFLHLDRALCDPQWLVSFPKVGVRSLAIKDSNHAPLVLDLLLDRERYRTLFQYLDAWSRDKTCKEVIKQAWAIEVCGSRSWQLVARLDNTRRCLSKWYKTHFGMCEEKLRILNNLLIEIQGRIPSEANLKLEADIILEIDEVKGRQANIWKQKSREPVYRHGDRNSKFFHGTTVIKRKRNFIAVVCVDSNSWLEGRQHIRDYFRSNFMDVLPFGNRLQRIFGNPVNCVLYGDNVDSWLHLFCHCPLAKATWFGSQWAIRGENLNFSCPRDFVLWLLDPSFLGGASKEDREAFSRNRAFHVQVFSTCMGVIARVNSACSTMVGAWEAPALPHSQFCWENGIDQINGRRAVFVDAACNDLRSTAGIVVTEADGNGNVFSARGGNFSLISCCGVVSIEGLEPGCFCNELLIAGERNSWSFCSKLAIGEVVLAPARGRGSGNMHIAVNLGMIINSGLPPLHCMLKQLFTN